MAFTWWSQNSYGVYKMGHLKLVKYTCEYNWGNVRMCYSSQSTERPISFWKEWLLFVHLILLPDFGMKFSLLYRNWGEHSPVTRSSLTFFGAIIWNRMKVAPKSNEHLITLCSFFCSFAKFIEIPSDLGRVFLSKILEWEWPEWKMCAFFYAAFLFRNA